MRMLGILLILSLVVSLDVSWSLRQTGLTLAGDADCKITEHTHNNCEQDCPIQEHVHTIECYSDEKADVETQLDWQNMFKDYNFTGNLWEDLVGIAKTQVGYSESKLNFEVGQDGVRHGYTRYGAWYGSPYNSWSATFVSFCLHYAGADKNQFPQNLGANSMLQQWKMLGKFAAAGKYTPLKGDLVFFKDNTVGIIAETFANSVYVVKGDVEGSVQTALISMVDTSISGWGKTRNRLSTSELLDISNGPAVYIFDSGGISGSVDTQTAQTFSLRRTKSVTQLTTYLKETGGTYYITLLDNYDHEVQKDHNGNYLAYSDTNYKITISSSAPNGFSPGTYVYQIPDGVIIDEGGKGVFKLDDGVEVGSWQVSDTGLIELTFTDKINDRSDVIISATMGVTFPVQEEPIDFDGKISVTVEPKHQEVLHTQVVKWGEQGHADNIAVPGKNEKIDPDKIYWTVEIKGNKNSNIPGSTVTDKVLNYDWSYNHYYSESDMASGIKFGASIAAENGEETYWHRWTVYPGDPNLTWDANGWSYIIPQTAVCGICGETITLGNEGCIYYLEYTSTPENIDIAGALPYTNEVTVDNQRTEGWAAHTQTNVHTTINKNGTFISDANGGKFIWEIQATIPGSKPNEPSEFIWSIMDEMLVVDQNGKTIEYVFNDLNKATVTANYYGTIINVPYVYDATENDPYAYEIYSWRTDQDYNNPSYNIRQMIFLKRCVCNEHNCGRNGDCWYYDYPTYEYCDCWTETEDTTFTITYETTDINTIRSYNSQDLSIFNKAILSNGGKDSLVTGATVPIPNIIEKEWITATSDYIVKYKITVNESKIVLSDGSPITIRDEMTQTLSFIRGTLVVTSVDADGNRTVLHEGVDYQYRYNVDLGDNDHNQEDHGHVLEIDILHPQPVTYYLEYDTTVVVQAGSGIVPVIKYQNSASISLWNFKVTDSTTEKTYTNVNLSSKSYGVEITKKASDTGKELQGSKFGLFNEQGNLIIEGISDRNGKILFITDVTNGIILKEHVLYYVQELEAPPGYRLNEHQYWFTFCSSKDGTCSEFKDVIAGTDAVRIPFETIGELEIINDPIQYDFPETGGIGVYPIMLVSVAFIITPLVYIFILRRKRKRRDVNQLPFFTAKAPKMK